MKFKPQYVLFLFVLLLLFGLCAQYIMGPSVVKMESPSPNSRLEMPPSEIIITFNEKIKLAQDSLEVIDHKGLAVTGDKAQISDDQQEIRLDLPSLPDGKYYVNYNVVLLNDEQSVKGSYLFQIDSTLLFTQIGNNKLCLPITYQQETSLLNELKEAAWIIYFIKAIYYGGLSLIVGWVFWWRIVQGYSTELKKKYTAYGMVIQILHLIGLFFMILTQLNITTISDYSSNSLINSNFDLLWYVSLVLSLIGFICLFRNKWFDMIWMSLILLLNGFLFELKSYSLIVFNNSAFLFAISIWAGGLLFTLSFWRKHRLFTHSFIPLFFKTSLWCIVVLFITCLLVTIAYLSNTPVLVNQWLFFLRFKLLAIFAVIITYGIIRSK
ncbi:copper resistance CopC family protein [Lysinibacillus sp. JNUCC-52]|uniref:copper resistance CopC family protein n=1 Tax=Lysinibacillus sp. JNUCC-52 TaxID=2792480 RepID=UPI0019387229|nr:copper resistance protein CopC [Lysinibacillus sp. JNUCC-52]